MTKNLKSVSLLIAFLSVLTSNLFANAPVDKYPGYSKTENGLIYKKLYQSNSGRNAVIQDWVIMEVKLSGKNDSVIFDTWTETQPVLIQVTKPLFKGDIAEAFTLMALHDSAEFICNSDSLVRYNQFNFPDWVEAGSDVRFVIRIDSIITKEQFLKMRADYLAKQKAEKDALVKKEQDTLTKYITDHKIKAAPSASGLYYIELKKGKGKAVTKGATVQVNYTGMLLNGHVFDTSIKEVAEKNKLYQAGREYKPFEFEVGQGVVIPGWDEGLALMQEGGKARFIIPSKLAYGETGVGSDILPYSTLIFEVELIKIKE